MQDRRLSVWCLFKTDRLLITKLNYSALGSPPDRPLCICHIEYVTQAQSDHSILLANVITSDNKQWRMIFGRMIDDVFWKWQIQSLEIILVKTCFLMDCPVILWLSPGSFPNSLKYLVLTHCCASATVEVVNVILHVHWAEQWVTFSAILF